MFVLQLVMMQEQELWKFSGTGAVVKYGISAKHYLCELLIFAYFTSGSPFIGSLI